MPLDPEIAKFVDAWYALEMPPVETLSATEWRRLYSTLSRPSTDHPVSSDDRRIAGPSGEIPIRVYRPTQTSPKGVFVYFHGGGWVVGSIKSHDDRCRQVSAGAECAVISVDYRLAPEHPYPAAVEDAYAATAWAANNREALGGEGARVAVGGDSAGGNLAAVVALMSRDRGGPDLAFQALVYPAVDHDLGRPSVIDNAEGYVLTRAAMQWYIDQYVPDVAQREDPYFAPILAESLEGLPPALVITAEYDPLRDEGNQYARRLEQAGVDTTLRCVDGAVHGFLGWTQGSALARASMGEICAALRRHLAT